MAKRKAPVKSKKSGPSEMRERMMSGGARGAMDATLKMHDVDPAAFPMQRGPKAAKKKGKR